MKKIKKRSDCPISSALDIVGDKWSLLIIRDIVLSGKNTYNEFLNADEKISTNVLADRLSMLERVGIIGKTRDEHHKQKVVYKLTQKGIDLMPVLVEIIMWSAKYDKKSAVDKGFVKNVNKDKVSFLKDLSSRLSVV